MTQNINTHWNAHTHKYTTHTHLYIYPTLHINLPATSNFTDFFSTYTTHPTQLTPPHTQNISQYSSHLTYNVNMSPSSNLVQFHCLLYPCITLLPSSSQPLLHSRLKQHVIVDGFHLTLISVFIIGQFNRSLLKHCGADAKHGTRWTGG